MTMQMLKPHSHRHRPRRPRRQRVNVRTKVKSCPLFIAFRPFITVAYHAHFIVLIHSLFITICRC